MAKTTFGSGVAGLRGRLGGAVFSSNTAGSYTKQLSIPVSRATAFQQYSRAWIVMATEEWAQIGSAARADWDAFALAPNEIDYDPWGVQRFLTGFQWFLRAYVRHMWTGQTWDFTPPSGAAQSPITNLSAVVTPFLEGDSYLSWDTPSFGSDDVLYVEMGISNRPARLTAGSKYLTIAANPDPGSSPAEITNGIALRWGILPVGLGCYFKAWNQGIHGNRSTVATCSCLVTSP